MNQEHITFEKISWAAFMARIFGDTGPDAYMSVYRDIDFRKSLVSIPLSIATSDVRHKLIKGFLNKWRSRFPNSDESANAILTTLQRVSPILQETSRFDIETVNLDESITVGARRVSIPEAVAEIFDAIANCYGFRTTPGAKIMGILNPKLFVMWDDAIALHYLAGNTENIFSGRGYVAFLAKMQPLAQQCVSDFHDNYGLGKPDSYLSEKLGLDPPLPLAKYLDEYNWITITRGLKVPPKWHPCDDERSSAT